MKSYKVDFDPTHTGYLQTQLWHISILQLAESPPHPGPGKRECTAFVLLTMNHPSPPLHLLLFVLFPCSRCFNESLSLLSFEALSQAINIQQKLIKKVAFVHRRSFQNNAHQHSKSTFFTFWNNFQSCDILFALADVATSQYLTVLWVLWPLFVGKMVLIWVILRIEITPECPQFPSRCTKRYVSPQFLQWKKNVSCWQSSVISRSILWHKLHCFLNTIRWECLWSWLFLTFRKVFFSHRYWGWYLHIEYNQKQTGSEQ